MRLLDKVTNGSRIEINETGKSSDHLSENCFYLFYTILINDSTARPGNVNYRDPRGVIEIGNILLKDYRDMGYSRKI